MYHVGCLGLPNWSEQNMIRRCLSLLFFERNDEDYRDNMKTVTHTSHHIRMLRDNEGTYENNTIREICSIYMYIFPASRCPCPIYIGWMFSFYLSHRSHYQPTSSYASRFWFSTRLKLFNLHFSSNLSILVMTINHTGLPPISVQHTKHRLWKPCSWPSWNRWGHQWRS